MRKLLILVVMAALVFGTTQVIAATSVGTISDPGHPAGRSPKLPYAGHATPVLVPAPSTVVEEQNTSDTQVKVFAEQQDIVLAADVNYDQLLTLDDSGVISAGKAVSSYFIHFDNVGTKDGKRGLGYVSFDQEILGLITKDASLAATDGVLGSPTTTYPTTLTNRGLEQGSAWTLQDIMWLSADKKTLEFDLQVFNVLDQLRVIIASTIDVDDVQGEFEAATGATPLSIPAAVDVGPEIAGLAHSGCADSISIPFGPNNVTVTAPAANPHDSLPGLLQPICVFEPGVPVPPSNTDPYPLGPTIVANGEDDYLLVFDVPVNAVGVELLTNSPAVETVTLKDAGDNVIASLSVDSLTSPNTFQFVGFTSPTPIKSVFVDTQGGGSQNEGISAIKVPLLHVDIDIKPGSDPNCFNNDGNGVIPVAILGSVDFDVNNIDPNTVALDGLTVKIVGKKSAKLLAHVEDVNSDGYDDLVVQIQDEDGAFSSGSGTAMVTGFLYDGTPFEGTDSICIVPPS